MEGIGVLEQIKLTHHRDYQPRCFCGANLIEVSRLTFVRENLSLMVGIVGFGSYVPSYRLPREVIAREWGTAAGPGEKAVANHDEDSLTLAVNAAVDAVADPTSLDAVFFASTTPPYREKQSATTVAAVLDAPSSTRTADFGDSLRAATGAMLAGLDAVRGADRL